MYICIYIYMVTPPSIHLPLVSCVNTMVFSNFRMVDFSVAQSLNPTFPKLVGAPKTVGNFGLPCVYLDFQQKSQKNTWKFLDFQQKSKKNMDFFGFSAEIKKTWKIWIFSRNPKKTHGNPKFPKVFGAPNKFWKFWIS